MLKKPVKIALAVSALTVAVATLALASVQDSIATIENGKLTPMINTSGRAAPAMLLPNALDKAAADAIKRRAADIAARKAALVGMQMSVIRLR